MFQHPHSSSNQSYPKTFASPGTSPQSAENYPHHHGLDFHQINQPLSSSSSKTRSPLIRSPNPWSQASDAFIHADYSHRHGLRTSYAQTPTKGDQTLTPAIGQLSSHDQSLIPSTLNSPSPSHASSPNSDLHPLALIAGVVDECDKYNPLVLHHARRQSIMQPVSTNTRPSRGSAYSPSRQSGEISSRNGRQPHQAVIEPHHHRQGLVYLQGSWRIPSKSGAALAETATPVSASNNNRSMSPAHAIISPIPPSRSSSSSTVSPSTLSPSTNRDSHDSCEGLGFNNGFERDLINRRMSLPGQTPTCPTMTRRMSYTNSPSPGLFDLIFQRVRNSQPSTHRSTVALTDQDFKKNDTIDFKTQSKDGRNEETIKLNAPSSSHRGGILPLSYPSSSSFTGSSESACSIYSRRRSNRNEGYYQYQKLFSERFIHQITFSLDETHKSGLQAILALRKLTNGLTDVKPKTSAIKSTGGIANGSCVGRMDRPNIPIPKISHRYPETNSIVIINGQQKTVIKKIVPSVLIDWSDGVQDEFNPTGMSLEEILNRCHFY